MQEQRSWLALAQNLPCGHNDRTDCPSCGEGTDTNAAIVNHNAKYYSIHCYACDYNDFDSKGVLSLAERQRINELNEEALSIVHKLELPKDITYEPEHFSREARLWLFKGGLTPSVWRQYSIGYSARLQRVILPVFDKDNKLIWFQCRAVLTGQKPKYIQPTGNRSNVYFSAGDTGTNGRVVIVEDIMSAIRVYNAISSTSTSTNADNTTVISLLGTKITSGQAAHVGSFEQCTTWLDGDKAGKRGSYDIRRTVGLLTECDNIRTEEDPKCYSNRQIQEILA